jgi:hypothetical protein
MKALTAGLLLLLVGCRDDVEMFPVNPGGGGSGLSGTGFVDAGIELGDGNLSPMISGRVCFLKIDARNPRACESTGAGGLTVTLGSFTAITTSDGSFSIRRPTGTDLVWNVTGSTIVPSVMSLSAEALIPAIDEGLYAEMLGATLATDFDGTVGGIINRVTRAEDPLDGVVASVEQSQSGNTFYDSGDPLAWALNSATGQLGAIWVPDVSVADGFARMVVNDGTDHLIDGIPVVAGAVTFVFTELP